MTPFTRAPVPDGEAPLGQLQWIKPASPVLGYLRILTNGESTLALLDLLQRSVPEEYRSRPAEWLYTHTTHLVQHPDRTIQLQMPALGLTDGRDGILFQIGIPDEAAWARLRGTTLPSLTEEERTIEFPPLPDHALW